MTARLYHKSHTFKLRSTQDDVLKEDSTYHKEMFEIEKTNKKKTKKETNKKQKQKKKQNKTTKQQKVDVKYIYK